MYAAIRCFLFSDEETNTDADSAVSGTQQVSKVGVACHEGLLLHKPILTTSRIRRLHQRCHEVSRGEFPVAMDTNTHTMTSSG